STASTTAPTSCSASACKRSWTRIMDQDLIDLIAAWKGKELEAARLDQLAARCRQDEALQQAFVDEIRMLGMLKVVQSTEPRGLGPGRREARRRSRSPRRRAPTSGPAGSPWWPSSRPRAGDRRTARN